MRIVGAAEVVVALMLDVPYAGACATGVLVQTGGSAHMLPVFKIEYYSGPGQVVEFMDLPTLCATKYSCLSMALADGVGFYHRDVARSQAARAQALLTTYGTGKTAEE